MYYVKSKTKENVGIIAFFVLVVSMFLTLGIYSTNDELIIYFIVLISFIVRVLSSIKASKESNILHRSDVFWVFFTFFSPPLGLILLTFLGQRIPASCSELHKEIIEKYRNESSIKQTQFRNSEISNEVYITELNVLEEKYNLLLTEMIDLKINESNNQVKKYYNSIDRIGGIPVIDDNDNFNISNKDNEVDDNKRFESCPACSYKLNGDFSECPECGLNLE